MASHYLIDYENVREEGVSYCHHADRGDIVYLIYTSNASKIGLDALSGINAAVKVIKVAAGKQSLDMHLISILGYIIHEHGADDRYIVISKDTGYDSVLKYWSAKGYKASRVTGSDAAPNAKVNKPEETKEKEPKEKEPKEKEPKEKETVNPQDREIAEAAEPAAAVQAEKDNTDNAGNSSKNSRSRRSRHSRASAGKKQEQVKQAEQKPAEPKPAEQKQEEAQTDEEPSAGELRKRLNGRIMSILAKEKVDSMVAGQIASLAVKNTGTKDAKRTIYRTLLQKFGQKQGLAYYTMIKKEL